MRFPDTPFMKRTFDLAEKLQDRGVKLIPYKFEADNTFKFFNGVHVPRLPGEPPLNPADPYNINVTTTYNPNSYVPPSFDRFLVPEEITRYLEGVLARLKTFFIHDRSHNFNHDMQRTIQVFDKYTMRTYLSEIEKLPPSVINLFETFDKSTGWYDRALTETICEDLAFNWLSSASDLCWKCFECVWFLRRLWLITDIDFFSSSGGSSTLPNAMEQYLNERGSVVRKSTSVVAISDPNLNDPNQSRGGLVVQTVSSLGGMAEASKTYPVVFCTAPLSTLGMMELSKSGIHSNYAQWSGIRELQYGPAIKIGIRFSKNWWAQRFKIVGGQRYGHAIECPLAMIG
jgi:hypothetical protein